MYEIITHKIIQLTDQERNQFFEIIHANSALFEKILPDAPLLMHVAGKITLDHPAAQLYNAWLDTKT
jgi:hypothetical protein